MASQISVTDVLDPVDVEDYDEVCDQLVDAEDYDDDDEGNGDEGGRSNSGGARSAMAAAQNAVAAARAAGAPLGFACSEQNDAQESRGRVGDGKGEGEGEGKGKLAAAGIGRGDDGPSPSSGKGSVNSTPPECECIAETSPLLSKRALARSTPLVRSLSDGTQLGAGTLSVSIEGWETNKGKFVSYRIVVSCEEREWVIKHRYRHFIHLANELQREDRPFDMPKLPPKLWRPCSARTDKFLERRMDDLDAYLKALLERRHVVPRSALAEFLNCDTQIDVVPATPLPGNSLGAAAGKGKGKGKSKQK